MRSTLKLALLFGLLFWQPAQAIDVITDCLKTSSLPGHWPQPSRQRPIWVVGAGDVVRALVLPGLLQYDPNATIPVMFEDNSGFYQNNQPLAEKMAGIADSIRKARYHYYDVAKTDDLAVAAVTNPSILFIATPDRTHFQVLREQLEHHPETAHVVIEKPLATSVEEARAMVDFMKNKRTMGWMYDHYRVQMYLSPNDDFAAVMEALGGRITKMTTYFIEDHSGSDPNYQSLVKRDGAIEQEQRVDPLKGGTLLDMGSHVAPLVAYFGSIGSMTVTDVEIATYRGVDGDPNKLATIEGETAARVAFTFQTHDGHAVDAVSFVGKGLRGVKGMPRELDGNVKVVEVVGVNGRRARFILSARTVKPNVQVLDGEQVIVTRPLVEKPYGRFLADARAQTVFEQGLVLPMAEGVKIMTFMDQARSRRDPSRRLVYDGGMASREGFAGRPAAYLEDVGFRPR